MNPEVDSLLLIKNDRCSATEGITALEADVSTYFG